MTVYTKTARGLDEIAHRSNAIGLRARRVLILIDGARTLDALQALSGDAELAATLAQLEEGGFISAQAAPAPTVDVELRTPPAPAPAKASATPAHAAPGMQMARDFMINTLRTFHGPYNKLGLMKRIQDSQERPDIEALIEEWLSSISETRLGRNRAQELKERLLAVM
ncbi:hypothetical protein M622_07940 [Thauera terpenica 58Eu]|jgi:hypothetical protein|uniref:Uncharacterized protein n=1 Tax=Thauera terpenica 58Eu TaxID=1348657 RepID=T0AM12_9RHOO|nr:hypothetical protein [Thauera terpenica]EPZ13894.1 hypothetical protein M622_07940 [Thauera terpenica 58Eu]